MTPTRVLAKPQRCGVYHLVDGRGREHAVAWVKAEGMSYAEQFPYPHHFADAMLWLAEQAPGMKPQVSQSLQRKE